MEKPKSSGEAPSLFPEQSICWMKWPMNPGNVITLCYSLFPWGMWEQSWAALGFPGGNCSWQFCKAFLEAVGGHTLPGLQGRGPRASVGAKPEGGGFSCPGPESLWDWRHFHPFKRN